MHIKYLTIGKSQDTDDKEKGDNNQQANSKVFVRVLIIPVLNDINSHRKKKRKNNIVYSKQQINKSFIW